MRIQINELKVVMFNFPFVSPIKLASVQAIVLRAPIEEPVQTSFGIMYDRPAVLVRIEDTEGIIGWGEIWCNFPSVGAEHRARLLEATIAPILLEQEWNSPQQAFTELTRRLRILAIQTGEPGTIAQAIAGADIALWDLVGKRAQQPLWQLLGGSQTIQTYASGLSPTTPEKLAVQKRDEGYRAFKLKVGFGAERDLSNLRALREVLGDHTTLMVDANQAWDVDEASAMSRLLAQYKPLWLEEPLPADTSTAIWQTLAAASAVPLAVGENLRGEESFSEAITSDAFAVIQPDLGKWGGFSGCLGIAQQAVEKNRLLCPHWLGGGIGLIASMHLKAAVGGPGYVEVDANPNPLREMLASPFLRPQDGQITLSTQHGLGMEPDLDALRDFRVRHHYK